MEPLMQVGCEEAQQRGMPCDGPPSTSLLPGRCVHHRLLPDIEEISSITHEWSWWGSFVYPLPP